LFDTQIDGRTTRVVATMGKLGIVDVLDARTGRYLKSYDLGMQNLVERINPRSGEKIVFADQIPVPDRESIVCPSAFGVRNFLSTAFDPQAGLLFVPMLNACMKFSFQPASRYDQSMREIAPLQEEGTFGGLAAIALPDAKQTWRNMQRHAISSAALATAGGVLFQGSRDRGFRAYESRTGRLLWETRLNASPNSYPITYRVAGRQYVAVVAGGGGPTDAAFRRFTPETEDAAPATTLLVFALPERRGP
jgi:alcohol dehydrogenase (cytochrome c)